MPRLAIPRLIALVLILGFAGGASAFPLDLTVTFTISGQSGNYVYDFTVRNDSTDPIEVYALILNEFTLVTESSPAGWAPFGPVQWCPGGNCSNTSGGIQPGDSLSGFSARAFSPIPLTEVSWTVAVVGPTVASLDLPNSAGDTGQFSGVAFELGASGKYSFEIISPPGAVFAQSFGINDAGQVVGGTDDGAVFSAYFYDLEDCTYTNIGMGFSPLDINNAGVIVGTADDMCAIRDELANLTFFQPPSAVHCEARGVNSSGKVSGFSFDGNDVWRGFIYDPQNGTYEEFLPSLQTLAVGLSENGDVVGSVNLDTGEAFPGSAEGRYAYLRKTDGSVKYFAIAQSTPGQSRSRGLSDSGLVSGFYLDAVTLEFKSYATTLSPGTEFEEITLTDDEIIYQKPCDPNLPPPPTSEYDLITDVFASHIRDDGVVVGSCTDNYHNDATGDLVSYSSGFVATPTNIISVDTDADGVPDSADNCTAASNADQRDTDGDDIGNFCDPDVAAPNDCVVNFLDLNVYRANFFQSGDLDTDNNGDGQTNFVDLNIVRDLFFQQPGPSATGCN